MEGEMLMHGLATSGQTKKFYNPNLDFMPNRGEIWLVDLGNEDKGDLMKKCRPCIIVSENHFNHHSNCVSVVPITHAGATRQTHVKIKQDTISGTAKSEQLRVVSKLDLRKHISAIDEKTMKLIEQSMISHLMPELGLKLRSDCSVEKY